MRTWTIVLGLLLALLVAHRDAEAYSGTVTGRLMFWNKQATFCASVSTGRDCSHSNYNEDEYNVLMPLSDMKVYVRNQYGTLIGSGVTDSDGDFSVGWYSTQLPSSGVVEAFLEEKDGRFQVLKNTGAEYRIYHNTDIAFQGPTNIGTVYWGTSGSPNLYLNIYDGAWRTWRYAYYYSTRLSQYFTNIQIRYSTPATTSFFDADMDGDGTEGIVDGDDIIGVWIDDEDALHYFTIYHELGHVGSFLASQGQKFNSCADYSYPMTPSNPGHQFFSQEYGCAQFEEGLATFLGNVGQYWSTNDDPYVCSSLDPNQPSVFYCPTAGSYSNTDDLETSYSCPSGSARFEANSSKFLRDLYDEANGADQLDLSFNQMVEIIAEFGDGTGNRDKNEPWNSSQSSLDDNDGRSTYDYRQLAISKYSLNSSNVATLYSANCSPVGD